LPVHTSELYPGRHRKGPHFILFAVGCFPRQADEEGDRYFPLFACPARQKRGEETADCGRDQRKESEWIYREIHPVAVELRGTSYSIISGCLQRSRPKDKERRACKKEEEKEPGDEDTSMREEGAKRKGIRCTNACKLILFNRPRKEGRKDGRKERKKQTAALGRSTEPTRMPVDSLER